MLVFVNPKAGFSVSAAFDFSSGGLAGNVSVKKLFGPSMVSSSNYGEKSQIKNGRMLNWYCDIGLE